MALLAFRPWAPEKPELTSLKDVLSRVNLERGHFRDITEASLQEEIAGEGALVFDESEDDAEDSGDAGKPSDGPPKPTTRKELYEAKNEMWQHVKAAEEQIVTALDFVSLLLSKDAPQGRGTMSPALKQRVEPGTMGLDVWQRMPVDQARSAQDDDLSAAVRMESLQQSADALLSAATRLEDNVRRETRYWDEILSISERGWSVCRIPRQPHRLAVTFGFSESSPDFSRRGIGALNADADGNITLERGVGTRLHALRVCLKRGDEVVGVSSLPPALGDGESTIEARMRHARDSLFDEELFHEMIRESRSITALGVTMTQDAIYYKPKKYALEMATPVAFELVPEGGASMPTTSTSAGWNALADAIAVSARLLLTQAHEDQLRRRSEVPSPLSETPDERPVLPILRPLMSFAMHWSAVRELNGFTGRLSRLLSAANVESVHRGARFDLAGLEGNSTAETLMANLMQPWQSNAELEVKCPGMEPLTFRCRVETSLSSQLGPVFTLVVPERESHDFRDLGELRDAADASLASVLAAALVARFGGDWKCNRREAMLVSADDVNGKLRSMWIGVDSRHVTLSLSSAAKKVMWRADGESPAEGFWTAWRVFEAIGAK